MERIRSVGDRPLALLRNWLPTEVADDQTKDALATTGLYALLRRAGVHPRHADQFVGARSANREEAERPHLPPNAALVTMRRILHDDRGRPVEIGTHVYDAANYAVEMNMQGHA